MKWADIFMGQSQPPGPPVPLGFTPQALQYYEQACKTPCLDCEVATFHEAGKRERQGDTLTCNCVMIDAIAYGQDCMCVYYCDRLH